MQADAGTRVAARISAVAGAVIGLVGLLLVFGVKPEGGLGGLVTAMRTIVGGALLVAAALAGSIAIGFWLLAAQKARRLRKARRVR